MFRGVTAALVTPLTSAGEVAQEDVGRLVASLHPHVDALLPTLSTGEGWALSDAQWQSMVAATVRHAGGLPVVAGIERPGTEPTLALARRAAELGAAAVAVTTPYGAHVTQRDMYEHYAVLTAHSGLPVVVYHESELSRNTVTLETLLRVCALPGVVAVKDSSNSAAFTRDLVAARPGVPVLQGMEELLLEPVAVDGYAIALATVEPELCARMFARPHPEHAARLRAACARYGLDRADWYRPIKSELHARGVLSTDATVARPAAPPAGEPVRGGPGAPLPVPPRERPAAGEVSP